MKNAAKLQQDIKILEQKIAAQNTLLNKKDSEIFSHKKQIKQKDIELIQKTSRIRALEELFKQFQQRQFGASSEKRDNNQLGLFNEAEEIELESASNEEETVTVTTHQRKKKPRVSIPEDLPREEIIYDLDEADKVCPHDGSALKVIGEETHEQLDIIPAQIKVIRHVRKKYACPCCDMHVKTANKPRQAIEKSIASAGLLAYIAISKYADSLPLYRQSEMFKRLGIELDRTNLSNWMMKCGDLIQPLINLLQEHIRQQRVIHLDGKFAGENLDSVSWPRSGEPQGWGEQTTVQVLKEPDKPPQSKSYMWLMSCHDKQPAMVFHYAPTRSAVIAKELVGDSQSPFMADGYSGYNVLKNSNTRLGCWAHARRKFIEAQKIQGKGKTGKADQALSLIQKLYAIEKINHTKMPEEKYQARQQQAKPVLDKLATWLHKSDGRTPPESAIGKALTYLQNQWQYLVRYIDDGHYPIDNNMAENAIRPFAVGRKNWLFSNSQSGAKASANLYSLIQTAKANELNPYEYLKLIFDKLPNANTVDDIEKLLPWNVEKI